MQVTPGQRLSSGPGLQRKPKGQVCEMTHFRLFAPPLDVFEGFHLDLKRKLFGDFQCLSSFRSYQVVFVRGF